MHEAHSQLAALAQAYCEQQRTELAEAQTAAQRLLQGDETRLGPLIERCHRLAGSSLSFGYDSFGDALQSIERGLQALQAAANSAASEPRLQQTLRRLLRLAAPPPEAARPIHSSAAGTRVPELPVAQAEGPALPLKTACIVDPHGRTGADLDALLSSLGLQSQRSASTGPAVSRCDLLLEIDVQLAVPVQPAASPARLHIVVSASDSLQERLAAVRRGAHGFFPLPLDLLGLQRRLELLQQDASNPQFRVLLVDDDALLLQRYQAVLSAAGLRVYTLDAPAQLLDQLEEVRPDVLVLDLHMPGYSGLELAQAVRYTDAWLQMPILYLSAERSAAQQLQALATAGEDFLRKPVSDVALVANVVSRAKRARALGQGLSRDGLTGLLRHADCKEHLAVALARAQREQTPLVVAMLDLDHFKQVNDRFGHLEGDRVLRGLASLLRRQLRGGDIAGRYGGEEFLLVLPNCTLENARHRVDDIRSQFKLMRFGSIERELRCDFSAGLVLARVGTGIDHLLAEADDLLYRAKAAGRGRSFSGHDSLPRRG